MLLLRLTLRGDTEEEGGVPGPAAPEAPYSGYVCEQICPRCHNGLGAIARELEADDVTTEGRARLRQPWPASMGPVNRPSGKASAALLQLRRTPSQRRVFSRAACTVISGKSDMLSLKDCCAEDGFRARFLEEG
jgi:hypothetical protein